MRTISIGETGPDWEPTPATRYYAQRGDGDYAFGATEQEAFNTLMAREGQPMLYLPPHKISLHLDHNQHKAYYNSIEEYISQEGERLDFHSEEDREACLATNEIWELQWYPETPVGFCAIAAPTLEALINYAKELHNDRP